MENINNVMFKQKNHARWPRGSRSAWGCIYGGGDRVKIAGHFPFNYGTVSRDFDVCVLVQLRNMSSPLIRNLKLFRIRLDCQIPSSGLL